MTDVATQLATHEEVIERGLATFLDVGKSLAAIRDGRLYRETHARFEDYCRDRWGFTDRRARQIIEAAEIGTMVPVENERQARALARVPEDQRGDVWLETTRRTDRPTAAIVREVAREVAHEVAVRTEIEDEERAATARINAMTAHIPPPALTSEETGPVSRALEILAQLDPADIPRLVRDWPNYSADRIHNTLNPAALWLETFATAWRNR